MQEGEIWPHGPGFNLQDLVFCGAICSEWLPSNHFSFPSLHLPPMNEVNAFLLFS